MRWYFVLALAIPTAAQTGSISGVIRDAAGKPVADCRVLATGTAARSSSDGSYSLTSLPAGMIQLTVASPDGTATSSVMLRAGDVLRNYDLELRPLGSISISGRVLDANGDPAPHVKVALRRREYRGGVLTYSASGDVQADEHGKYEIKTAQPGESYLVDVYPPRDSSGGDLSVPPDPKDRPLEIPHTYYPGTRLVEDAAAIAPAPGESRGGIDIRVTRAPTYCIDGSIDESGNPAAMQYTVQMEDTQGRVVRDVTGGVSADDGRFQNCHLFSGTYRIWVNKSSRIGGVTEVTVHDSDVHALRVSALPLPLLTMEWVWDSEPPDPKPAIPQGAMELQNLDDSFQAIFAAAAAERARQAQLPAEDFSLRIRSMPAGYYLKDLLLNGVSTLRRPVITWQTIMGGADVRCVVGRDGGSIAGAALDSAGTPLPNVNVVFIPENALNPADLPEAISTTLTDQRGAYQSATLSPGRYRVVATRSAIRPTPECMEKLWRARTAAQEVEVQPGSAAVAKLIPAPLL